MCTHFIDLYRQRRRHTPGNHISYAEQRTGKTPVSTTNQMNGSHRFGDNMLVMRHIKNIYFFFKTSIHYM